MNDVVVALLQRAKERLAGGWCQRSFKSHAPFVNRVSFCASGALIEAAVPESDECYHAAREMLMVTTLCGPRCNILVHNDRHISSQIDALDWFDRAIKYAKDQGV